MCVCMCVYDIVLMSVILRTSVCEGEFSVYMCICMCMCVYVYDFMSVCVCQ